MITIQKSGIPIYLQIYNAICDDIKEGRLTVGSHLEAERILAKKLGVNRNTVRRAYQKLHDEGYLITRQGSAHYIQAGNLHTNLNISPDDCDIEYISPLVYVEHNDGLSFDDGIYGRAVGRRQMPNSYYFMGIMTPPDLYPTQLINQTLTELIASKGAELYDYCSSKGLPLLRSEICRHLEKKRIDVPPGQVVIGNEVIQLADYLLHIYIKPGDIIITEEPVFTHIHQIFKLHQAKVITIPMDEYGIRTDLLHKELKKHKPKLLYLTPDMHNPTNISMSLSRRLELLNLARQYEVPVIEQTFCDDLGLDAASIPPLKALDTDNFVIYIGSFNNSFTQSMPISYVVANPRTTSALVKMIQMTVYQIDTFSQHILAECLKNGTYNQHLAKVKQAYQQKQAIMYQQLDKYSNLGLSYIKGQGGGVVWCKLPAYVNAKKLLLRAQEERIFFHPGTLFFPDSKQGKRHIRLSFLYPSLSEIVEGIDKLAAIIKEQKSAIKNLKE